MNHFLKSRFLLFFVIFSICISDAKADDLDVWAKIGKCFANPCSCAQDLETEEWVPDDYSMKQLSKGFYEYDKNFNVSLFEGYRHTYDPMGACPPYVKFQGRKRCLKQFRPPIEGSGWANANYRVYCAEATENTSFAEPKIRVRMQSCNFAACFTNDKELNGLEGECVIWPTQYGIPTIRFCARVAIPRLSKDHNNNLLMTPDPGYYFHYLDTNGYPRPDPGIITSSNQRVFVPKICLYEDPSVYEGLTSWMEPYRNSGMDYFDFNPYKMPYHNSGPGANTTTPSFWDVLTFSMTKNEIVENSYFFSAGRNDELFYPTDEDRSTARLVTSDLDPNRSDDDFVEVMGYKVDMKWARNYEIWLDDFVYKKKDSLGCVNLPVGPYPQPFCALPAGVDPGVSIQKICPYEVTYDINLMKKVLKVRQSTSLEPCVTSKIGNNFIKNSVRASLDDLVNKCKKDSDDPNVKSCIKLSPSTLTAKIVHEQGKDILPVCDSTLLKNNTPCVITKYSTPICPQGSVCENKMRIVYGYKLSSSSKMLTLYGYPTDSVGECSDTNTLYPCATIMGINKGQYADITLNLNDRNSGLIPNDPKQNKGYGKLPNDIILSGYGDSQYYVSTYISYAGDDISINADDGAYIQGNSICMYYTSSGFQSFSGCVKRAPFPGLKAELCQEDSCYSDKEKTDFQEKRGLSDLILYVPKMKLRATYQGIDKDSSISQVPTEEILALVSAKDLVKGPYNDKTRMYYDFLGVDIDTVAIDDSVAVPPFTSPKAPIYAGVTILGSYQDSVTPLNSDQAKAQRAKYLGGLEYLNGLYFRGGNRLIGAEANYTPCHMVAYVTDQYGHTRIGYDDSNCVLAKLNYYDSVDCQAFKDAGITKRCKSNQVSSACTTSKTLGSGDNKVSLISCPDGSKCYQTSLPEDVCAPSVKIVDRVKPEFVQGDSMQLLGKYYDTSVKITDGVCASRSNGTNELYNIKNCGTRDKTILERGVNIVIPDLYCPEITFADESNGNATWSKVKVGEKSVGTCGQGFGAPPGGLKDRLCYGTNDRINLLEDVTFNTTCLKGYCEPITVPDVNSGYATWDGSYFPNGTPSSKCADGLKKPRWGFSKRMCNKEISGKYYLSDLPKEEFCYRDEVNIQGGSGSNFYRGTLKSSRGWGGGDQKFQLANLTVSAPTTYTDSITGISYDKYIIEVGHPEYWKTQDSGNPVQWVEKTNGTASTIQLDMNIVAPNGFIIKNLKVIANNTINSIQFTSNGSSGVVNISCDDNVIKNSDGTSVCPQDQMISSGNGLVVGAGYFNQTVNNLNFAYYNSNPGATLTGGALRFELHIPLSPEVQNENY